MNAQAAQNPLPADAVILGRLGKAHGLKGELKFLPFGCERDLLLKIRGIHLGPRGRDAQIKEIRGSGKFWILALEGVESRSQAENLQGELAWIRENQLPPLPPSELYVASVIGAEVRDESGVRMGQVTDVMETTENDILIVRRETGEEELIPALRSVLLNWEESGQALTVRWPVGEGQ